MKRELPDDEVLLAIADWQDFLCARILTKAVTDGFCVAVVDTNGALGAEPYETLEFFVQAADGCWHSAGDSGPAGGAGWHDGFTYLCDQSSANEVTVIFDGQVHRIPTETDGWFAFAAPQDECHSEAAPRRYQQVGTPPLDAGHCPVRLERRYIRCW